MSHHPNLARDAYKDFKIKELENSIYIKPFRVEFKQNGIQRNWDCLQAHESVSCILYNTDKNAIILVKQFRPAVFVRICADQQPNKKLKDIDLNSMNAEVGITYELCSGLVDKEKSLVEITHEEILEECGYHVPLDKIYKVNSFSQVGMAGVLHTIFYAEVNNSMLKSSGGGNAHEGEFIEIYELKVEDIKKFSRDESITKTTGVVYGLNWFLYEREDYFKTINSNN